MNQAIEKDTKEEYKTGNLFTFRKWQGKETLELSKVWVFSYDVLFMGWELGVLYCMSATLVQDWNYNLSEGS